MRTMKYKLTANNKTYEVEIENINTRPVVVTVDGQRFTYGTLAAEADRAAALLHGLGLPPGGRVVVFVPNSAAAVTSLYGVWRAGGCVVMAEASRPSR